MVKILVIDYLKVLWGVIGKGSLEFILKFKLNLNSPKRKILNNNQQYFVKLRSMKIQAKDIFACIPVQYEKQALRL